MSGRLLVVLRHGPTDWNAQGRIQGRCDRPLSPEGRRIVKGWRLDPALRDWRWATSPLARARETAALLGHPEAEIVPALSEMDWGDWEGRALPALREADPVGIAEREALGLDLRPPGGESPRDVQDRLRPWLAATAGDRNAAGSVAVCHKGVIRALYALAVGWDMTGRPPEKLRDGCCHRFRLDPAGFPAIERLNEPLLPLAAPDAP